MKIVSSNVDLSGLEVETASENRRAFLLKDKIENFLNSNKNDFDYIFSHLRRGLQGTNQNDHAGGVVELYKTRSRFRTVRF